MTINDTQYLNNGYPMPSIGLGVYKITDDEMNEVVNSAIEAGYRAFDTAYFYGNEQALGRALSQTDVDREDLFITSKLWNDYQGYDSTIQYFNKSLENLGLDYLDLFLIHWPCEDNGLFIESYKALETLYHEGKVKAIGVCNFNQHELQQYCDDHDIKVTAWMPLMRNRGLLDDPVILDMAKRYKKTPAQIVLRWHLAHNRMIIPKSKTPSRIKENYDILDFNLELTDVAQIDSLNQNARQGKDPDEVAIGDLK